MTPDKLIPIAAAAREAAYCPYSKFAVGAVLLTSSGKTFAGCNVENISFGLTLCAERNAVAAAVAAGDTDFTHLVLIADTDQPISPCGACRQVLAEFAPDLSITSVTVRGGREPMSLAALLPRPKTGILNYSQE